MAVKPTWRISQKAFIPLSTLMLIFTGLSVTGYYSPLRRNREAILFTTSRMPVSLSFIWGYQSISDLH